jgi:predicted SnoaL-like aldol condensation-catalyzing enzyme
MKTTLLGAMLGASLLAAGLTAGAAQAQEAVVGAANPDALFTSPDPVLNRNKQAAYHIMKDLLECHHWDQASTWLTDAYHQHNPNAATGLKGVIFYFTQVRKDQPLPCPEKMKSEIVAVVADGDYVTVVTPRHIKNATDPSKNYDTTWFDMWRFKDGKADEHWDPATKQ